MKVGMNPCRCWLLYLISGAKFGKMTKGHQIWNFNCSCCFRGYSSNTLHHRQELLRREPGSFWQRRGEIGRMDCFWVKIQRPWSSCFMQSLHCSYFRSVSQGVWQMLSSYLQGEPWAGSRTSVSAKLLTQGAVVSSHLKLEMQYHFKFQLKDASNSHFELIWKVMLSQNWY